MMLFFVKIGLGIYNVVSFVVVFSCTFLNGYWVPSRWKEPVHWRDEEERAAVTQACPAPSEGYSGNS